MTELSNDSQTGRGVAQIGMDERVPLRSCVGTIKYRLAHDFQLAIITLLGTITLVGITPFMLLRVISGNWVAFGLDLAIETSILGSMFYAWRSCNTHGPSLFLAYFLGVMAALAVFNLGAAGRYWYYPAIVANFFLISRRHALAIAMSSLTIVLLSGAVTGPTTEIASFAVTVAVCALLSYAFAYRTAVQRTQLETLATKDALTGVCNRRTLLDEMERARRTFLREQRSHGILILDLDHFKNINDVHGHLAGDRVLIALAGLLEKNIRKEDRLFRYGGEEFVILTQRPTRENLEAMAEQLRGKVEQNIRAPDGRPITASIGGAVLNSDEPIDSWFARADKVLYAAKNAGRNRAMIAPEA